MITEKIYLRIAQVCVAVLLASNPFNQVRSAASSPAPEQLIGLWKSEQVAQQAATGELTIDGRKSQWQAIISGLVTSVERTNDGIRFALPNNAGEFRGRLVVQKIVGHWIQLPNEINDNSYATPVELIGVGRNLWRGQLNPLDAQLTLWMSIQRVPDGSLTAIIRNPEFNLFRRNIYRVDASDRALTFFDSKDSRNNFKGKMAANGTELAARVPSLDRELLFKRQKSQQAVGFYPRTTNDYNYQRPSETDDGWSTAQPSDVDVGPKPIAELIDKILHVDPTNNPLNIHSLLIARHGKLVLEEYFYGFQREQPHDMRSASKTFAPLLVGIAQNKGAKIDIDTPVYSQFAEYKEFANPDPRKSKIAVRDLITMTPGLACDDNDDASPGNEDVMQQQKAQSDWYKYTLDLPMARDPGGDQAVYCSAGINLLGGIIRNTTHAWLPEFFHENVAKPLQIKTYHWNLMPTGDGYAGGGLYLRPRDQLKLGQLYLNGGVWNGKRVISKDWVERSTSRQSTFGKTLGADHDYGYGWHLYHFEVGDRSYRAYAAGGNGGQIVMVIPDLDLVVGFTGGAYGEFPKWYKWQTELVPQFIIPATVKNNR